MDITECEGLALSYCSTFFSLIVGVDHRFVPTPERARNCHRPYPIRFSFFPAAMPHVHGAGTCIYLESRNDLENTGSFPVIELHLHQQVRQLG
jgi:hypothetical protein